VNLFNRFSFFLRSPSGVLPIAQLKSKVRHILDKDTSLRINLNIDDASMTSGDAYASK
jgi:hypothetical protein